MSPDAVLRSAVGLATFSLLSLLSVLFLMAKDVAHFEQAAVDHLQLFKEWSDSAWTEMQSEPAMRRDRRSSPSRRFVDDSFGEIIDSEVELNVRDESDFFPSQTSTLPPSRTPFSRDVSSNTISVRRAKDSYSVCNCAARAATCPQGPAGEPGAPGSPGDDGAPGRDGAPGANGITVLITRNNNGCIKCPAGPPGPPGIDGQEGIPGPGGPDGPTSVAGYRYAREGAPGPPGDAGAPGSNGMDGTPGRPAPPAMRYTSGRGAPGPPGAAGPSGPAGAPGWTEPGEPGVVGAPGRPGFPGAPGNSGVPGEVGRGGAPGQDAAYCPCPPHIGQYQSPDLQRTSEIVVEVDREPRTVDGEMKRASSRTGMSSQSRSIRAGVTSFGENDDLSSSVRSGDVVLPYNPLTRSQFRRKVIAQNLAKSRTSNRI